MRKFPADFLMVSLHFCSDLHTVAPKLQLLNTGLEDNWWQLVDAAMNPTSTLEGSWQFTGETVMDKDVLFSDTRESHILFIMMTQILLQTKAKKL